MDEPEPAPAPTEADPPEGAAEAGTSDGPAEFEAALERVARAGAGTNVLLMGESGAGKSRAARRLHELSDRAAGPFVTAHVAGLSETLLEAELFGHVAGAFTGAAEDRDGRFRRADGGTLVLEAIDTLARPLQVKLLRVLQERVVEPVGSAEAIPVDVRVVATTSRDLAAEVRAGAFREDLYYRLAVVTLTVPPLRAQPAVAFGSICEAILAKCAARTGVPARPLGPAGLERLAAHPWPGNYRELENALERALVLGAGAGGSDGPGPLGAQDFAFLAEAVAGRAEELARDVLAHGVALDDLERALFRAALDEERGNASAAARRLGLTRRAFDYRRGRL